MRFIRSSTVERLYQHILKRNPTQSEIKQFKRDYAQNPKLPDRIGSMIDSKEFEIMIMPEIVRKSSENFIGENFFFLVLKTHYFTGRSRIFCRDRNVFFTTAILI